MSERHKRHEYVLARIHETLKEFDRWRAQYDAWQRKA